MDSTTKTINFKAQSPFFSKRKVCLMFTPDLLKFAYGPTASRTMLSLYEGVCSNGTAPSVSSINRILRNRAAERAASEYAHHATAFPFFPPFGFPPPALQLWSGWAGGQRLIGGGCSDRMESEDEADQKSPQASTPGRYNLLFNFEDLLFLS